MAQGQVTEEGVEQCMFVDISWFTNQGAIFYKAGRQRGMSMIALWSQNIANHFWYCCHTCNGDLATLKVVFTMSTTAVMLLFLCSQNKLRGVLHHICDKHEWYQGECEKDALTEPPTNTYGIEIHTLYEEIQISNCFEKYSLTRGGWVA